MHPPPEIDFSTRFSTSPGISVSLLLDRFLEPMLAQFGDVFGVVFALKMRSYLEVDFTHFLSIVDPLGTSKIELSPRRESNFQYFRHLILGTLSDPILDLKRRPKLSPRGSKISQKPV